MKKEYRIKIFEKIRDIPYRIIQSDNPEDMLKLNAGHCAPKHILLVDTFRKIGIKTNFVLCTFKWSEVENLPDKLKVLAKKCGANLRGHLAATSFINGKWILLDATWDKPIEKLGFHVNEWDGISDTTLAVKPIGKLEVLEDVSRDSVTRTRTEMKFYDKLNEWLDGARK